LWKAKGEGRVGEALSDRWPLSLVATWLMKLRRGRSFTGMQKEKPQE
jgi:hypothetical protein